MCDQAGNCSFLHDWLLQAVLSYLHWLTSWPYELVFPSLATHSNAHWVMDKTQETGWRTKYTLFRAKLKPGITHKTWVTFWIGQYQRFLSYFLKMCRWPKCTQSPIHPSCSIPGLSKPCWDSIFVLHTNIIFTSCWFILFFIILWLIDTIFL